MYVTQEGRDLDTEYVTQEGRDLVHVTLNM